MILYHPLYPGVEIGPAREIAHAEMSVGGWTVLVEQISPCQVRIVRLLSTDPADYLMPELQPGSLLPLSSHGRDRGHRR